MTEIAITKENLFMFKHMIPLPFQQALLEETLVGVGMLNDYADDIPVSILLCRVEYGWMEVVWMYTEPDYRDMGYAHYLLKLRLHMARHGGKLWGAFADLPEGEVRPIMEKMFCHLGFQLEKTEYSVYTISLEECSQVKVFHQQIGLEHVVPLEKADHALQKAVIEEIRKDKRPIPLPEVVDWQRYDQKLSAVYVIDQIPTGMLLVSHDQNTLTIECIWVSNQVAIVSLLSYALQMAEKMYPMDTEIVIPTVTEVSTQLVKKIFPHAEPMGIMQAKLQFPLLEQEVELDG